jgi:hypothetical protein
MRCRDCVRCHRSRVFQKAIRLLTASVHIQCAHAAVILLGLKKFRRAHGLQVYRVPHLIVVRALTFILCSFFSFYLFISFPFNRALTFFFFSFFLIYFSSISSVRSGFSFVLFFLVSFPSVSSVYSGFFSSSLLSLAFLPVECKGTCARYIQAGVVDEGNTRTNAQAQYGPV